MKKEEQIKVVHRNDHKNLEIFVAKRRYSEPKLFIPKRNGKSSVAPGDYWYVYFWWRTDPEGPFDYQPRFKRNLNYLKTVKERKEAGKVLKDAYHEALKKGWNPQTKSITGKNQKKQQITSLEQALKYALDIKKKANKSASTIEGYQYHMDHFIEWCDGSGYSNIPVTAFKLEHFYEFWDWLRTDYQKDGSVSLSGTSINNYKRSLSALFTTMKNERLIDHNFIKGIPYVDQKPVKNKAFTTAELVKIKKALEDDDPYLIPIIQLIMYTLLRPREVMRLQIKDFDTEEWILSVKTKTEVRSTRRVIEKLKPTIQALNIESKPGNYHVFTRWDKPDIWKTNSIKYKVDVMGRRFNVVKARLGFGDEYGLYSFRHTAIVDLYQTYINEGLSEYEACLKIMPHTKHRSVESVKVYIRQYSYALPPDHSDLYSINF